jgi:hypothetical protein
MGRALLDLQRLTQFHRLTQHPSSQTLRYQRQSQLTTVLSLLIGQLT